MDLKIGCDPEFFVKKDGQLVSAYGLVEGTKHNPYPVPSGAVQVDGMALEYNIEPVSSALDFVKNNKAVLNRLRKMIPADYEFVYEPVAHFGSDYIQSRSPDEVELGCDPDYNAYTGEINPKPNKDMPFRTASGHIHIGWTENEDPLNPEHFEACQMLTKQLDYDLGFWARCWDTDTVRKSMYGGYGAFRPKPYGMEYRVLSNAWLQHPALMELVAAAALRATKNLLDGYIDYGDTIPVESFMSIETMKETLYSQMKHHLSIGTSDWLYEEFIKKVTEKKWSTASIDWDQFFAAPQINGHN